MGDGRHLGQGLSLTTSGPCASGCVQPGHDGCGPDAAACECACHRPGPFQQPCDQPGCDTHRPDPACRGCRPRPAVQGLWCGTCWALTRSAVALVPALVPYLRACLLPGVGQVRERGEEARTKAAAAPASVNLTAVDFADLIVRRLVEAHAVLAPVLGMTATVDTRGLRVTAGGDVTGFRAGADGWQARWLAVWLHTHLDRIAGCPEGAVVNRGRPGHQSLVSAVHAAARAFPMVEDPSWVRLAACPGCGRRALRRHPPTARDLPVVVTCSRPGCGWAGTDNDLDATTTNPPTGSAPCR